MFWQSLWDGCETRIEKNVREGREWFGFEVDQ